MAKNKNYLQFFWDTAIHSVPGQNVHAAVIRAIGWGATGSSSHLPQCIIPVGLFMVGHLFRHLEWGGDDTDFIPAAGASYVDGLLRPFWLWYSAPDFSFLVAAAMGSSSLTEGSASPRREHPTAEASTYCSCLCRVGAQLEGSTVVMHSDNLRAIAAVNLGYSKVPKVMHLLRCLFYPSAL